MQHLFSAILNRDQAYQSILDQGMILGLPWGTDLDPVQRRGRGSEGGGGGGPSPSVGSCSNSLSPDEAEGDS